MPGKTLGFRAWGYLLRKLWIRIPQEFRKDYKLNLGRHSERGMANWFMVNSFISFSEALEYFVKRTGYSQAQLSRITGIPKATITNWMSGRVHRPRSWGDLMRLAQALHLTMQETTTLFASADYSYRDYLLTLQREQHPSFPELPIDEPGWAPFQAINDLPYFVGREDELQALEEILIREGDPRMIILEGMAGVGKTALVARLAYRLRPYFPDGVLWAEIEASDPADVLATFAAAQGHEIQDYPDLDSRSRVYREIFANKRSLIVLDNAWSSDPLRPLMPPTGESVLVVTTRRRNILAASGAWRFYLPPFSATSREALSLFEKFMGLEAVERDKIFFRRIAILLGQLPLALGIAASRLAYEPGWDPYQYLKQIHRRDLRLGLLSFENQSIRQAFQRSYLELQPFEGTFFASLAAFRSHDFTIQAAAELNTLSRGRAEDYLRRLYNLSLIEVSSPAHYLLHPLMSIFAEEKAAGLNP